MSETAFQGMNRLKVFHVADVRAEIRVTAFSQTKSRFQFCSDSKNCLDVSLELYRQRGVAACAANGQLARFVNANH